LTILILGAGGMLGHRLWLTLRQRHTVVPTARHPSRALVEASPAGAREIVTGVDASQFDSVVRAVADARPQVVVNCIGIVKQRPEAKDPIASLTVNALFPHRLASLCRAAGARLVHVSTDCVFSGARGRYVESDAPDADDLYGRTKLLGEVQGPGNLTLRTSIIGRELATGQGLVEWFLAQPGPDVPGYARAIFSGLTTHELSRVVSMVVERFPGLEGLYHVAADPIAKADLLALLNEAFACGHTIRPVDGPAIDRSLDGSRFRAATGWSAPSWPDMVREMARDAGVPFPGKS
jgi:dTDP-4-dehydrorhamnose reductase